MNVALLTLDNAVWYSEVSPGPNTITANISKHIEQLGQDTDFKILPETAILLASGQCQ